jgi:hypothetical protein
MSNLGHELRANRRVKCSGRCKVPTLFTPSVRVTCGLGPYVAPRKDRACRSTSESTRPRWQAMRSCRHSSATAIGRVDAQPSNRMLRIAPRRPQCPGCRRVLQLCRTTVCPSGYTHGANCVQKSPSGMRYVGRECRSASHGTLTGGIP